MIRFLGFRDRPQVAKSTLESDVAHLSPILMGRQAPPPSPVVDVTRRHHEVSSSASLPPSQRTPRNLIRDPSRPQAPPGPAAAHRKSPRNSLRTIPESSVLNSLYECDIPTPRLMDDSIMEAMGSTQSVVQQVPDYTNQEPPLAAHAEYVDSEDEEIPWAAMEDPFAKAPLCTLSKANTSDTDADTIGSPVMDYLQVDIPDVNMHITLG